jgi:hypothetical protein
MALRLAPEARPAQLQTLTGLSRHTILRGLTALEGYKPPRLEPRVKVSAALLAEPTVGDQAKVLYGLIQTLPGARSYGGRFTYASLRSLTGWSLTTLRRAISELAGAHWIRLRQKNRLTPISFRLGTPEVRRAAAEAEAAARRLERAENRGEALMQEYLSLLVDCTDFADNIKPGWLVNPLTGERLELDRFYISKKVAFEYHGDQHHRATERFPQASVESQIVRDFMKAGRCLYEEVLLVVLFPEDLSLQGMLRKVGRSGLPMRSLDGQAPLVDLLERESITYFAGVQAGRRADAR